jgi:hypothetical protein
MKNFKFKKCLMFLILLAGIVCLFPKDVKACTQVNINLCTNNKWQTYKYPAFKNQRECLNYLSRTDLSIEGYRLNGKRANATLDGSKNSSVSISITSSRPASWYRVWICKAGDTVCGTWVQYWFVTVPPYIKNYVSDSGQWDGKDYMGNPVPNGKYYIRVYIADQFGNELQYTLKPHIITVAR